MVCPYNAGVDCLDTAQCYRCGWNPVVAAERLRKWMESHSCNR
jgi:aryl-alcohol dehydrogenase-like predicted oxidoreductase